jgi:hypothetical protein
MTSSTPATHAVCEGKSGRNPNGVWCLVFALISPLPLQLNLGACSGVAGWPFPAPQKEKREELDLLFIVKHQS